MAAEDRLPDELVERLARVPLFSGLTPDARNRIAALARRRAVAADEVFFREGEPAEHFHVLASGRVKIVQTSAEGHQVVLRLIGPWEAFGGVGAFGDPVFPATAEAVEPSTALVWDSAAMRGLVESEPRLAVNALHFVAARLADLQARYRQLMTERVEQRVARALLRLVRDAGRRVDGGVEIAFPVSRQDLAELAGTTLFTASRLLSAWEQNGIVRSTREHIVVTRPHALVTLAEGPGQG